MIAKLNPVSGWLLVGLVVSISWGGFATFRWISASSRCDTRIATAKGNAQAEAREHYATALGIALRIFDGTRAETADAIGEAAGNTKARDTQIIRVPVTGACVMPKGLPSLAPAVKEARDAAAD